MIRRLARLSVSMAALNLVAVVPAIAMGAQSADAYNLSAGPTFHSSADRINRDVTYTFTLLNGSSRAVFIRRVGRSAPGLVLRKPSSWYRVRMVPPHRSISETVTFYVSDCSEVPKGSWPIHMDAALNRTHWQRINLELTMAGTAQWQTSMADSVCS